MKIGQVLVDNKGSLYTVKQHLRLLKAYICEKETTIALVPWVIAEHQIQGHRIVGE